jgi:hypothetical protein
MRKQPTASRVALATAALTGFNITDAIVTDAQALEELKRELQQRREAFPRMIAKGWLTPAQAAHRIAAQRKAIAIVERSLGAIEVTADTATGDLFNTGEG